MPGSSCSIKVFHRKGLFFFFFLVFHVIPQFGLLCYLSSLSLSSGHSGPVLNLRTDDAAHASLPIPHLLLVDMNVCTSSLQVFVVRCIFCVFFFFFFFPWLYFPLRLQSSPQTHLWKGFLLCENFYSFMTPSPGMGLSPYIFCLYFHLLYFVLPSFKEIWLTFWVPGVLCQRSEVVLWKSLNIQMIFWWICGGESGLPILFLLHLGSVPSFTCLFNITVNILGVITNFCLKVSYILCLHKKNLVSWTTYLSSS